MLVLFDKLSSKTFRTSEGKILSESRTVTSTCQFAALAKLMIGLERLEVAPSKRRLLLEFRFTLTAGV